MSKYTHDFNLAPNYRDALVLATWEIYNVSVDHMPKAKIVKERKRKTERTNKCVRTLPCYRSFAIVVR